MAVTITRTPWQDDDGTGTTGTVINAAWKTELYGQIDQALAKVAQLAGGNTFTGNQTIAGLLTVTGLGQHAFSAAGVGGNVLAVMNTAAGTGNYAQVQIGNDASAGAVTFQLFSSAYTSGGFNLANGLTVANTQAGGISMVAFHASGALRFYTGGGTERMRIAPTGEVVVGATASNGSRVFLAADNAAFVIALGIQNLSATNNLYYAAFYNNAGAPAGSIVQTGATTVSYGTSSDARLKDDAGRASDLSSLRAITVHDFTWKADGRRARGVFAQEAAAVFPLAITAGTDERTAGGDLKYPWMTDYSKFVPDLIAGWQQHDAAIAELRAAVAAAKG